MRNFFEAKNIAIVGASRNPEKVGHVLFKNLIKNPYLKIFPINPNAFDISGVRAYPDVLSLPFKVDLVIVAIKAEFVPEVLEQCGQKEIKNVIIISSGFAESGNLELNEKSEEIAKKYDIKIIGPNVLGIIGPYTGLNASFFKEIPKKGNVAFISQSGAVGTSVLDRALQENLGFSGFVSLGNMMNQDFLDALEYFGNDKYTEVIILYVESLKAGTGRDFVELCKRISRKKRIIAINSGKTLKGVKAAKTHTAALSSPSEIYSGAFKQAGIIEVESLEEMFKLAEIFSRFPKLGKKAGIITNAGGLGVLATDACVKNGIEITDIPANILAELDSFLPVGYSRNNPLDILGDALADRYGDVLRVLARRKLFDFFIVIVSPQEMTQPLETAHLLAKMGTPVFACFIGGKTFESARKFLMQQDLIVFDDVFEAGKILGKATR